MLINQIFKDLVESATHTYHHEAPAESDASKAPPYQIVYLLYMAKQVADFGIAQKSERNKRISELILLGGKIGLDTKSFGTFMCIASGLFE